MKRSLTCLQALTLFAGILPWGIGWAEEAAPSLFQSGIVSSGFDDSHLAFSPDGQTIYFLRNTPDFAHWTILTSKRDGNHWRRPTIARFSGRWSDADVFVTRDGQWLFFVSTRPVNDQPREDTDIWMVAREGDHWGEPRHVPELSSPGYEWFPTLTDAGVIYFGSERKGGAGRSDLWRARWLGNRFSAPENLGPTFNSPDQEIEPLVAPDERWLIFAARGRTPSAGSYDLYISYNCPAGWSVPKPLGAGVNSPGWDFGPRFSPDGKRFYFTSNRADTAEPYEGIATVRDLEHRLSAPRNGLRDIYEIDAAALDMRSPCGPSP